MGIQIDQLGKTKYIFNKSDEYHNVWYNVLKIIIVNKERHTQIIGIIVWTKTINSE